MRAPCQKNRHKSAGAYLWNPAGGKRNAGILVWNGSGRKILREGFTVGGGTGGRSCS